MGAPPSFSVIVPAYQAASLLAETLPAIRAGLPAGHDWELIVVDDGSDDATSEVARRYADRVLRLEPPHDGPGRARNAGAAAARGEWLLFVDADVRLHVGTIDALLGSLDRNPDAVGIFGSYDARPQAGGLVSQFRNLLHHRVHSSSAGPARTFWSGLGAMRRDAFAEAGGFNARRFHRAQMEDIELGYRLTDEGHRIVLDPDIQGTHLKHWTLGSMIRTDFLDRGIPWTRLLLERRGRTRGTLAASRIEVLRVALVALAVVALALWLLGGGVAARMALVVLVGAHLMATLPVYLWFGRQRGPLFGLLSIPLLTIYYLVSAAAGVTGLCLHLVHRRVSPG